MRNRKFYDYTIDSWQRIAVVDWKNSESEDFRFGKEMNENQLPKSFFDWETYESFNLPDCTVDVRSEFGE